MNEDRLTPPQRDLLHEILAGQRTPTDPEVQAAARDPLFEQALADLVATTAALDAAGRAEREWRADGAAAPPVPGEDRLVRTAIERLARGGPGTGAVLRPASRRRRWRMAAAAAVLAAVGFWWWPRPQPAQNTQILGPAHLSLLAPEGNGRSALVLHWDADPGLRFFVEIYDPQAPSTDQPVLFHETTATAWELKGEELSRLRRGLHWRVHAREPGGTEVETIARPLPADVPARD